MANEITYNSSLIATKTNFSERIEPGSIQIDLSSSLEMLAGVKDVTNASNGTEIVALTSSSSLDSGGMFFFRNLSTASGANVDIGVGPSGSFIPFLMLKPGEYVIGRLGSEVPSVKAVFARATTATAVELQFKVFDGA